MLKTGIQSTTSIASQATSSYISSGGDWSGIIASTAGSLVTNSLGEINTGSNGMKVDGFNSAQKSSIGTFNSFAGGAVSTAVTYGMTGNATLNVASIAGQGVLEMHFGKDGFHTNLGTGGTDVSAGTLSNAVAGAGNWGKNIQINSAAKANNMAAAATALRVQHGFGDTTQKEQLADILSGKTKLAAGGTDGRAQTVIENGQRVVHLSGYSDSMSRDEQLAMGITLGHEAYRDGVDDGLQGQVIETINAVIGHAGLAYRMSQDDAYKTSISSILSSDELLGKDVSKYSDIMESMKSGDKEAIMAAQLAMAGQALSNYDYTADYWKVISNGNIVYDGQKNLVDENGNLLHKYENPNGGYTDALAEALGISAYEANSLMVQAGFDDYKDGKFIDQDKKNVTDKNQIQTSDDFKSHYDFQLNYADNVMEQ